RAKMAVRVVNLVWMQGRVGVDVEPHVQGWSATEKGQPVNPLLAREVFGASTWKRLGVLDAVVDLAVLVGDDLLNPLVGVEGELAIATLPNAVVVQVADRFRLVGLTELAHQ